MGKTVLIAGKDSPDGGKIADGFAFSGRQVVISALEPEADLQVKKTITERRAEQAAYDEAKSIEAQSGMCTFEWNKSSPVSARALILQTENTFGSMDEAVLYFDEEWFASRADKMDSEEIARTSDEMFVAYQYMAMEILARFEKKFNGKPFSLVFLLKDGPCVSDALKFPALRNGLNSIASPIVAAAASAFEAFAENIAALYGDQPYVNVILVRGDKSMESCASDESIGKWLGTYLDGVDELKTKLAAKKSIQWIKPGAKVSAGGISIPAGLNFFARK